MGGHSEVKEDAHQDAPLQLHEGQLFVRSLVRAWASSALAPVERYRIECHGAHAGPAAGGHNEVKADTYQDTPLRLHEGQLFVIPGVGQGRILPYLVQYHFTECHGAYAGLATGGHSEVKEGAHQDAPLWLHEGQVCVVLGVGRGHLLPGRGRHLRAWRLLPHGAATAARSPRLWHCWYIFSS